jgi:hypothetical protein
VARLSLYFECPRLRFGRDRRMDFCFEHPRLRSIRDRPLLDSSGWGSGAGTGSLDWVPANEDGVFPYALIRIRRVKREKSSLVDMLASRDC